MKTGIEIELPAVDTPNIQENEDPLVISINKNNEIFLSDKITLIEKLNPKLVAIKNANPVIRVSRTAFLINLFNPNLNVLSNSKLALKKKSS